MTDRINIFFGAKIQILSQCVQKNQINAQCWHYRIFGYCRSDYQVAKRKVKSLTLELLWALPQAGFSSHSYFFSSFAVVVVVEESKNQQVQTCQDRPQPQIQARKGDLKWSDTGVSWGLLILAKNCYLVQHIKDMLRLLQPRPPWPRQNWRVQLHNLLGCTEWQTMRPWIIEVLKDFLRKSLK